jgi:NAD(P)-dependent dehydrogenase (short-subunit alcohol dehydrogenase family)
VRVVISGVSGGLGEAVVRTLLEDPACEVHGLCRSAAHVTVRSDRLTLSEIDLADAASVDAWEPGQHVDALIHCAAVGDNVSFADADTARWERFFSVNVVAAATLTQRLLPRFTPGASVVFVNSGLGLRASSASVPYSASKAALKSLADAIRPELNDRGVSVTTVYPGQIATPMLARNVAAMGRPWHPDSYIQPEELARILVQLTKTGPSLQLTDVVARPAREPW